MDKRYLIKNGVLKKIVQSMLILAVLISSNNIVWANNQTCVGYNLDERVEYVKKNIPQFISDYAEKKMKDVLYTLDDYYMGDIDENSCILKSPFIIIDMDEDENEEIYYFPVSDGTKIIILISIINTTEGLSLSAGREYVDMLQKIKYDNNSDVVFYKVNDSIYIEKYNCVYKYTNGFLGITDQNFVCNNNKFNFEINKRKLVDVDKIDTGNKKEEYTPGLRKNDYGYVCKLFNQKGQGSLPICWAASVATIVNYIQGKNVTAKQVCRNINHKYTGGNIDTKEKALNSYGIKYTQKRNRQLNWSEIVENIQRKSPIAASTFSKESGHAITIYGYRTMQKEKSVIFWNSADEDFHYMSYKNGKFAFEFNNKFFVWKKSLSME